MSTAGELPQDRAFRVTEAAPHDRCAVTRLQSVERRRFPEACEQSGPPYWVLPEIGSGPDSLRMSTLDEILFEALRCTPEERSAYLDHACGSDRALRVEVESLLAVEARGLQRLALQSELSDLPESVGRYPIHGELGRGSMGIVYLAVDPRLGRPIAIKLLPPDLAQNRDRRERFEREARLLAAVQQTNIATIHSLEESDGLHFLTMEYVPGRSLADVIRSSLDLGDRLHLLRQIACALEAAHKGGVIHRDLKPANIRVTRDNAVKVLDFGIAKYRDPGPDLDAGAETQATGLEYRATGRDDHALNPEDRASTWSGASPAPLHTQPGSMIGTPGYMSPEQIRGEPTDPRSDLWAFGCIAFEVFTGERLCGGETGAERIASTMALEPSIADLPEELPVELRDLLRACVAKEVRRRPESITPIRRALEREMARRMVECLPRPKARESSVPNNLPRPGSRLVGRSREIEEISRALDESAIVTLTGVGGCGKTRLALAVAEHRLPAHADGVFFVDLASIASSTLVINQIASVLGLKEAAGSSLWDAIREYLRTKSLLLLLDNCEHVASGCVEWLQDMLPTARNVHVLATSREALGVTGERIRTLAPLPVPDPNWPPERLRENDAVTLFVEHAQLTRPEFRLDSSTSRLVARVCRDLEGIPLALELAAARLSGIPLADLASRIDDRFRLVRGSGRSRLPRHETLDSLIGWSYDLLSREEQLLLPRLSVFYGGFTLAAAEAVCAGAGVSEWDVLDLLSQLVGKSLLDLDIDRSEETSHARYRLLETVRQFAERRWDGIEERAVHRHRHRDFYLALAERAQAHWGDSDLLREIASEQANLGAAIQTCREDDPNDDYGLRFVASLGPYWELAGNLTEGRAIAHEFLERSPLPLPSVPRALALRWAGILAWCQGDNSGAETALRAGLDIAEQRQDPSLAAKMLLELATVAMARGEGDDAASYLEECLRIERAVGNDARVAATFNNLGNVEWSRGNYDAARTHVESALEICRRTGDQYTTGLALATLGYFATEQARYDEARQLQAEALAIFRRLDSPQRVSDLLHNLGTLAYTEGDYVRANVFYDESLQIRQKLGSRQGEAECLGGLGLVAAKFGSFAEARTLSERSLSIRIELGDRWGQATMLNNLGKIASREGDVVAARGLHERSLAIRTEISDRRGISDSLLHLGTLAKDQGEFAEAQLRYEESLALRRELDDRQRVSESFLTLGKLAFDRGELSRARDLAAESLRYGKDSRFHVADSLLLVARMTAESEPAAAASVVGCAEVLRDRLALLSGDEVQSLELATEHMRRSLGEVEYTRALHAGRSLSLERAVKLGLTALGFAS